MKTHAWNEGKGPDTCKNVLARPGILGNKILMPRRHDCDDTVNSVCQTIHLDFVV